MHKEELLSTTAKSLTHPGRKRPNNEDFVDYYEPIDPDDMYNSGRLYIVADGVGGAAHGEQASKYAVQKVLHDYYQQSQLPSVQRLEQAMEAANIDIYGYSKSEEVSAQMATTIVAALLFHNQLVVANVGDSPAYLIREGQIRQLSRDHSLVGERIRDGTITEEEARTSRIKNQLTRSLGGESHVLVEVSQPLLLIPGDRIILCTDGITRYASRQQILQMAESGTPEEAAERLVDYANQQGGADNITILVVQIDAPGANEPEMPVGAIRRPPSASLTDMDTYTPGNSERHRAVSHFAPKALPAYLLRRMLTNLPLRSGIFLVGLVLVTLIVVATALAAGSIKTSAAQTATQTIELTATMMSEKISEGIHPREQASTIVTPTNNTIPNTPIFSANSTARITVTPPAYTTQPANQPFVTPGVNAVCVYQVKTAQNLSMIAQDFSVDVQSIVKFYETCAEIEQNQSQVECKVLTNIANKDNIQPGQWIVIPVSSEICNLKNPPGKIFQSTQQ